MRALLCRKTACFEVSLSPAQSAFDPDVKTQISWRLTIERNPSWRSNDAQALPSRSRSSVARPQSKNAATGSAAKGLGTGALPGGGFARDRLSRLAGQFTNPSRQCQARFEAVTSSYCVSCTATTPKLSIQCRDVIVVCYISILCSPAFACRPRADTIPLLSVVTIHWPAQVGEIT